jgi:hypothetical protein
MRGPLPAAKRLAQGFSIEPSRRLERCRDGVVLPVTLAKKVDGVSEEIRVQDDIATDSLLALSINDEPTSLGGNG